MCVNFNKRELAQLINQGILYILNACLYFYVNLLC